MAKPLLHCEQQPTQLLALSVVEADEQSVFGLVLGLCGATQVLLELLKNPLKQINRIELPTELVVRSSTSPPKDRTD